MKFSLINEACGQLNSSVERDWNNSWTSLELASSVKMLRITSVNLAAHVLAALKRLCDKTGRRLFVIFWHEFFYDHLLISGLD